MTNPAPAITIPVDLTNPGQFFACCGLLELADRLWPGAEGWFDGNTFYIASGSPEHTLRTLCQSVMDAELQVLKRCNCTELQLCVTRPILLDWWRDYIDCDADHLRTWSGRQVSLIGETVAAIKAYLRHPRRDETLFDVERTVWKPGFKKVAPLGFDAGRVGTSQDLGVSADNLGQPIACCVWTEFLTLIAVQRFALTPGADGLFRYRVWRQPLTPMIAATAARSSTPSAIGATGSFRLARRSTEGYYAFQLVSLTEWRTS